MLSILGSLAVGVAQFGASVFLAQYFQVARDHTPTEAGLLMLPLILGNMIGATGTGQYITRTGRWKGIMLVGGAVLVVGLSLMGTIDHLTPMWHLSAFMVLMGLGTGALMQNLVLVVQNTVDVTDVGAASGSVSFFRSLGGTIGVAALGAVLASSVADKIASGMAKAGIPVSGGGDVGSLDLDKLPPAVATIVRTAYADATGRIFLIAGVIAVATFVAVALMPVTELRTTIRKAEEPEPVESADEWSDERELEPVAPEESLGVSPGSRPSRSCWWRCRRRRACRPGTTRRRPFASVRESTAPFSRALVTASWTPSASRVVSMVSSRVAFCTPILTSIRRTSLVGKLQWWSSVRG